MSIGRESIISKFISSGERETLPFKVGSESRLVWLLIVTAPDLIFFLRDAVKPHPLGWG